MDKFIPETNDTPWQNIDDIYREPVLTISKGNVINLYVKVEGDFELFESRTFGVRVILTHWQYLDGKYIKPFKLQDYTRTDKSFHAELKVIKKSKEVDELKLLCEDLISVFNMENLLINDWEVTLKE